MSAEIIFIIIWFTVWIGLGVATLVYTPFLVWCINFRNKLMGTKTEITKTTIVYAKVMNLIVLIFGCIILYLILTQGMNVN